LPGCTDEVADRLDQRIAGLERRVRPVRGPEPPPAPIDLGAARAELQAIWQDPCLAPLARFFPVPEPASPGELEQLFEQHLGDALTKAIGAKWSRFGERVFVIPPTLPGPLAPEAERALAPWSCGAEEAECSGHAGSYVARSEAAFDRAQHEHELWRKSTPGRDGGCRDLARGFDETPPLEAWGSCVIGNALWTHRYARRRYRVPERGWLVLRGRRGHYSFADEIHAYDLETGSAYVARSSSALVLDATEVDQDAVDRKRELEVLAGTVVTDQVRELAFALVTLPAVLPIRTEPSTVLVPPSLGLALGQPAPKSEAPAERGPLEFQTSAQTEIAFSLVAAGKMLAEGEFTWPDSWRAAENHADGLLIVLEAGLERRCPPAPLPRGTALGAIGAVSPIDADPGRQEDIFRQLARALEGFVPACADSRRERR